MNDRCLFRRWDGVGGCHIILTFDRDGGTYGLKAYVNGGNIPLSTADIDSVGDISNASDVLIGSFSNSYSSGPNNSILTKTEAQTLANGSLFTESE